MRVMFVTSEVASLFKLGGLADVSYALPAALSHIGVDMTVVLPFYTSIALTKTHCIGNISVNFDGKREIVFLFTAAIAQGNVPVVLMRHPKLNIYDWKKTDLATFVFFAAAVAELYLRSYQLFGRPFDIVHCHDWHTALVPLLVGETNKTRRGKDTLESGSSKTILTIHNPLYQGQLPRSIYAKLGLPTSLVRIVTGKKGERVNMLREGLEYADVISTVSPTFAKELGTGVVGSLVGEVLKRRREKIVGTLNGIDPDYWNPATDTAIPQNYIESNVEAGKKVAKRALRNGLHLADINCPLIGFVGRLEPNQKGTDLIIKAAAHLMPKQQFQLVILGTGTPPVVKRVEQLVHRFSSMVGFISRFDEKFSRLLYAGSDMLLVPSKFEPCGLTQLIAMRYGTIPLVRQTGGLADTVEEGQTGFVFKPYTPAALSAVMERAISVWQNKPDDWRRMILHVMKQEFSWDKSAKKYRALYRKLLRRKPHSHA